MDYFLKFILTLGRQNAISITSKLSLLKNILWKRYKAYYEKFTVVLCGKLREIIFREKYMPFSHSLTQNWLCFFKC